MNRRIATVCAGIVLVIGTTALAAVQVLAVDVHTQVPTHNVDLQLSANATLAPVVGADGETLVGTDGRDRCVALAEPPAIVAAPPDLAAGVDIQADADPGSSVTLVDRPLTVADTVPC